MTTHDTPASEQTAEDFNETWAAEDELNRLESALTDRDAELATVRSLCASYKRASEDQAQDIIDRDATIARLTADLEQSQAIRAELLAAKQQVNDHVAALMMERYDLKEQVKQRDAVIAEVRKLEAIDHGVGWPDLVHALAALDRGSAQSPTPEQRRAILRQMVRDAEDAGLYDQPEASTSDLDRGSAQGEQA